MGGCNVLLPVCEAVFEALLCLRRALRVGDFQVATGGGFWVAIGAIAMTPDEWGRKDSPIVSYASNGEVLG